jgi:hypothetical protein
MTKRKAPRLTAQDLLRPQVAASLAILFVDEGEYGRRRR